MRSRAHVFVAHAAHYAYDLTLVVKDPPTVGKVALLHVEIGYRFMLGDLSLLLEHGTQGTCVEQVAKSDDGTDTDDWFS